MSTSEGTIPKRHVERLLRDLAADIQEDAARNLQVFCLISGIAENERLIGKAEAQYRISDTLRYMADAVGSITLGAHDPLFLVGEVVVSARLRSTRDSIAQVLEAVQVGETLTPDKKKQLLEIVAVSEGAPMKRSFADAMELYNEMFGDDQTPSA